MGGRARLTLSAESRRASSNFLDKRKTAQLRGEVSERGERESAHSIANTKMVIIDLDANRRKTAREDPMRAREDPFSSYRMNSVTTLRGREDRGAKHKTNIIIIHLGEPRKNCKGEQEDCISSTKMNSVTTPREGKE